MFFIPGCGCHLMELSGGYQQDIAWHGPLRGAYEARFNRLVELLELNWEPFEDE